MIDESSEELAALYALGLLEGAERTSFESVLGSNAALAALVHALRRRRRPGRLDRRALDDRARRRHRLRHGHPRPGRRRRLRGAADGKARRP